MLKHFSVRNSMGLLDVYAMLCQLCMHVLHRALIFAAPTCEADVMRHNKGHIVLLHIYLHSISTYLQLFLPHKPTYTHLTPKTPHHLSTLLFPTHTHTPPTLSIPHPTNQSNTQPDGACCEQLSAGRLRLPA